MNILKLWFNLSKSYEKSQLFIYLLNNINKTECLNSKEYNKIIIQYNIKKTAKNEYFFLKTIELIENELIDLLFFCQLH